MITEISVDTSELETRIENLEDTIEEFEQIIDYFLNNNVQIVTWKMIYDTFKSGKLEERIKELEN